MRAMKSDWILAALRTSPLDRLRLMKSLFLLWWRSGRQIPGYFRFEPYLYGPCSFEVYSTLRQLDQERMIVQVPYEPPHWGPYYLTAAGRRAAEEAVARLGSDYGRQLESVIREIAQLTVGELLSRVYAEAPQYAVKSIARSDKKVIGDDPDLGAAS